MEFVAMDFCISIMKFFDSYSHCQLFDYIELMAALNISASLEYVFKMTQHKDDLDDLHVCKLHDLIDAIHCTSWT